MNTSRPNARHLFSVAIVFLGCQIVNAQTLQTIDFEQLPDGAFVTNQYEAQGVVFVEGRPFAAAGATYFLPKVTRVPLAMDIKLPNGRHLHADADAHSGRQVADISTCISKSTTDCEFATPAAGGRLSTPVPSITVYVGAFVGGAGSALVTMRAFDANHALLGTSAATVSAGSGFHTPLTVAAAGIVFFEIVGPPNATSRLGIDDLSFEPQSTSSPPDFDISGPASVEIRQGSTTTTKIAVGRLNGSSGLVTFHAMNPPVGVSAQFSPGRSTPGAGPEEVTLELTAAPDAPLTVSQPGKIRITGDPTVWQFDRTSGGFTTVSSGAGPASRTLEIVVAVRADFALTLEGAAAATVPPCGQVSVPLLVTRATGFNEPIQLAVAGLPVSVTGTFSANPILPGPSGAVAEHVSLLLSSLPLSGAGNSVITITAASGPLPPRQVSLPITTADSLCCANPGQAAPTSACLCELPHGTPVPHDVEKLGSLDYRGEVRVINVYWGGNNWDGIPGHADFRKEDIERATTALFATNYFDPLCQYGVPPLRLLPGVDTGQALNPCLPHAPQNNFTTADLFQFVSCEEGMESTDVPHSGGIPTPVLPGISGAACQVCGVTPLPCYLDGVCLLAPNPTGDLIVNVISPKDKAFAGIGDCSTDGFHYQVPSNALGYPLFPVPTTQGRPIYFTFIRTECFTNVDDLMTTLSHELVEALTDPYPGAFWWDNSQGTAAHGEIADEPLCSNGREPLAWVDSSKTRRTALISRYWSNYHHECIAPHTARQ